MTSRDEAMWEAAQQLYTNSGMQTPSYVHADVVMATAGADAERKRIVEWLRDDCPGCSRVAEHDLIDAIERGDHWKDSQ